MKYIKLFENWINEASNNLETINTFTEIFSKNGFNVNMDNGVIKCSPTQYDNIFSNITSSYEMEILDSKNPSNQNLKDGITLKTNLQFPKSFIGGRWTLDPMDIFNLSIPKDEAESVKKLIENKFSEYLNTYGFMILRPGGSSEVCFNGKWASYYEAGSGDTWNAKDLKSKFTPEEIKIMKSHKTKGRLALEELLKEVESIGKNIFKFELEKSTELRPGYKLTSATTKNQVNVWKGGESVNLSTSSLAKGIQDFLWDLKNNRLSDSPETAGLNNSLYTAISYALGKASMIDTLYSTPKLTLALAGIYGNSVNQYQPQVAANWSTISNNMQIALNISPEELQQFKPSEEIYTPSKPMIAPTKKQ